MPSIPYASLGFVGFVQFETNPTFGVRATSCDLKLSQAIEKPEVVTGKFDRTVYKLGPKEVGGAVAFPAVLETVGGGTTQIMDKLWELAVFRSEDGRLTDFDAAVKYTASNATFRFEDCMINSFKWSVTQGDLVNVETDIIGRKRNLITLSPPTYDTRNTRAATWADVDITVALSTGGTMTGEWIRSFESTINNNVERFYTCNGELNPQDIAPKMREITGSMTLMGRNPVMGQFAEDNQNRCNEDNSIRFGYQVTNNLCNATWFKKFCGVVFEIETMSLSNDIVESSINWHALPGGAAGEMFDGDASCDWT